MSGAKTKKRLSVKSVLKGNALASPWMMKQMNFILFLFVLAFGVISMRYMVESTMTKVEQTKKRIKALRASSIAYEAELMRVKRPSTIAEKVAERNIDIKEPQEPPHELVVKKISE